MRLSEVEFTDLYLGAQVELSRFRGLNGKSELAPPPEEIYADLRQIHRIVDQQRQNAPHLSEFVVPFDDIMYRVTVIPDVRGHVYALRRGSRRVPTLSQCGIHPTIGEYLLSLREGLVLFAGGFGAGKTTSACAFVREFTARGALSVSMEDPPELPLSGDHGLGRCLQVQVDRRHIEEEVEAAMRMAFDLLFISEIRSGPVAKEIIGASTNGRLIVSTIHADGPVSAVTRLVSLASEGINGQGAERVMRDMLGSGLAAVIYMSKMADGRRAATDYLIGGGDVRAKISANEIAGLQNSINMIRNRLSMKHTLADIVGVNRATSAVAPLK